MAKTPPPPKNYTALIEYMTKNCPEEDIVRLEQKMQSHDGMMFLAINAFEAGRLFERTYGPNETY